MSMLKWSLTPRAIFLSDKSEKYKSSVRQTPDGNICNLIKSFIIAASLAAGLVGISWLAQAAEADIMMN
jgi:hypothetical protein